MLKVIDSIEELNKIELELNQAEYVSFDTETNGLHLGAQVIGYSLAIDSQTAYYIILQKWDIPTNSLIVSDYEFNHKAISLLRILKDKKLICHNGVFDCQMVEANFNIKLIDNIHTDTLILAHLLNENRKVGLKELAKEYLGEDSNKEQTEMKASILANGGKITSKQYDLYKADPYLIGKYGAKDAQLTYQIFEILVVELEEQGLWNFFYEDESMPLLRGPTYELNNTGLKVDQQALMTLKKTLEAEVAEAKAFIYSEIDSKIKDKYPGTNKKNTFNISASQQLAWLMFGEMGLEFNRLTDAGKLMCKKLGLPLPYTAPAKRDFIAACTNALGQTHEPAAIVNGKKQSAKKIREPWAYIQSDKRTLDKYAIKYKWIARLLEYKQKMKLLTTYVKSIEERTQYGIIRPSFLQHGTTSGRYSSRSPNFQNLPRDDKRIKTCIVSRPGKSFVGADYSQLEPRVFAYFSGDERLRKAFDGTSDFYSVIGMEVYSKTDCTPQKEGSSDAFGVKYKKLRDLSKVIALASTYGATAHQLAPTTGKSIEDTQMDIDNYFESFPGVAAMMLNSHKEAKETGQTINLFGRPRRMPEAKFITKRYGKASHADLPYEVRNLLNLAVNHKIQSTGASIVNRAMIAFHRKAKELGLECKIVSQIHDEIIVECKDEDAENVSLLLQHCMETNITLPGVALEAIPRITKTLAK